MAEHIKGGDEASGGEAIGGKEDRPKEETAESVGEALKPWVLLVETVQPTGHSEGH